MHAITAQFPRHARASPGRAALTFEGDSVSWGALNDTLDRLAAHIAARVPAGGGLALHLPNGPTLALLFFAAARAGREAQVLDPAWPAATLNATLAALSPALTVTVDPGFTSRPNALVLADALPFRDVAAAIGASPRYAPPPEPDGRLPFYVGFTSGSTGQPKGYRRDHRSWAESFRADAVEFGIHAGDVVLAPGSLTHSLFLYAMANGLHAGAAVVFCRSFRPSAVPGLIAAHGVTVLYGVPTHLRLILDAAASAGAAPFPAVRWVLSSGAKWSADARPGLKRLFPSARFAEFYGASELSFVTVARDDEPVPAASVGRAFTGVTLSIRDRRGRRLPPGRVGRVFAESPFLFSGYAVGGESGLHRVGPALSVGDTGILDDKGFLTLVGRENRMIVTSGKNLFPEEVERVLERHVGVAAAAVFGAPDAKRGERLVALVALTDAAPLSRAALIAHARGCLPLYKVPRRYYIVTEWPRTASGKSDFQALRRVWQSSACEVLS